MNKNNLLAIDIGNTTTMVAVLKNKKIMYRDCAVSTLSQKEYEKQLAAILLKIKKNFLSIDGAIICSVVPKLTGTVEKFLKTQFKIKTQVVGRDIKVLIKNNYHKPQEVGQDRLVCAHAVRILYGVPAIVIDLGTAITIDVVSSKGAYEGGMIIPGIRLSLLSLKEHTALLPKVDIKVPKHLIGKNTQESMLGGVFFGYGAMLSGLIDMLTKHLKGKPKIIITGGYTDLMKKFLLHKKPFIEKDLIFKGMALL